MGDGALDEGVTLLNLDTGDGCTVLVQVESLSSFTNGGSEANKGELANCFFSGEGSGAEAGREIVGCWRLKAFVVGLGGFKGCVVLNGAGFGEKLEPDFTNGVKERDKEGGLLAVEDSGFLPTAVRKDLDED